MTIVSDVIRVKTTLFTPQKRQLFLQAKASFYWYLKNKYPFFCSLELKYTLFLAAAVRVEAERSCAVRSNHFHNHMHHQPPPGCATGLSWLGTNTPKSSVFAPPVTPDSAGGLRQSNNGAMWHSHNEKVSQEKPRLRESPVKSELNKARRSGVVNPSSSAATVLTERTDTRTLSRSEFSSNGSTSSCSPIMTDHDKFRTFSAPSKKDKETRNRVPHTQPNNVPTSNSVQQEQQSQVHSKTVSDQLKTSSIVDCESQEMQQSHHNEGTYQQQTLQDSNEEVSLSPVSASSMLSYSQSYKSSNVTDYDNSSAYQSISESGKNSLSNYNIQKNKSKNRSVTGRC